ncbi:hypothetical protein C0993_008649 [Termitomyces sp. T159_Od127]|nr:hypothetical protein C0993_008649 [Termitomyces sp. T159_Od127]
MAAEYLVELRGVVNSPYFQKHFGLDDQNHINEVSSNVVSVLQAGAFFGSLGSAPVSGEFKSPRLWIPTSYLPVFVIDFTKSGRDRLYLYAHAQLCYFQPELDGGVPSSYLPLFSSLARYVFRLKWFKFITCPQILTTVAQGSKGLAEIYSGRVISGIGIGAISAVSPAFVSECAPKDVRGRITGCFQIMVALGVMISYFINFGVGIHILSGARIWRIPFGLQLVPAGIMVLGLLTIKESPRWLASVDRREEAITTLAYLRKDSVTSQAVVEEMYEIQAAIEEEREAREGLGWKEAFLGKGNFVRFVIAFVIFLLQQWAGQNSVNYYAPQIFEAIGFTGLKNSLLASGIYGVVKFVATTLFIFFGVETLGRKLSLFISAIGMGTLFYIIGALLKTHPPPSVIDGQLPPAPPPASRAMAGLLYIYVCFYSMGWGPLPWVYVSDIFPTRTRHYGLAVASASQWLWNFVVSKVTPQMVTNLGYKIFLMFATVNIGAMGLFALLIPETKGRSLEEMDIIFGAISADQRQADIEKQTRGETYLPIYVESFLTTLQAPPDTLKESLEHSVDEKV